MELPGSTRNDEVSRLAEEFNCMLRSLHEARRRLETEAESRRRLEQSLRQADKLISIGQLSARLAHEIGSPLQVLNGRARALLSKASDLSEVRRNAQILVTQTERIVGIVEQLLSFGRRRPGPPASWGSTERRSTEGSNEPEATPSAPVSRARRANGLRRIDEADRVPSLAGYARHRGACFSAPAMAHLMWSQATERASGAFERVSPVQRLPRYLPSSTRSCPRAWGFEEASPIRTAIAAVGNRSGDGLEHSRFQLRASSLFRISILEFQLLNDPNPLNACLTKPADSGLTGS
jgi:hypothetical protein